MSLPTHHPRLSEQGAAAPTSRRRPGTFTRPRCIQAFGELRCLSPEGLYTPGLKNNGPGEASTGQSQPRRNTAAWWSRKPPAPCCLLYSPSPPAPLPRVQGRGEEDSIPHHLEPPLQIRRPPLAHRRPPQRLQVPARAAAQPGLEVVRAGALAADDAAVAVQNGLGRP